MNDLIKEIQTAYDIADKTSTNFLNFLKDKLNIEASLKLNYLNIWLEVNNFSQLDPNRKTLILGTTDLPNQSRLHKHSNSDYRLETRSVKAVAFVHFSYPNIDDIWDDIKNCAVLAATTTIVAAIISGDVNTALGLFYPAFYECLKNKIGDRAKDVDIEFSSEKEYTCWTNHCP